MRRGLVLLSAVLISSPALAQRGGSSPSSGGGSTYRPAPSAPSGGSGYRSSSGGYSSTTITTRPPTITPAPSRPAETPRPATPPTTYSSGSYRATIPGGESRTPPVSTPAPRAADPAPSRQDPPRGSVPSITPRAADPAPRREERDVFRSGTARQTIPGGEPRSNPWARPEPAAPARREDPAPARREEPARPSSAARPSPWGSGTSMTPQGGYTGQGTLAAPPAAPSSRARTAVAVGAGAAAGVAVGAAVAEGVAPSNATRTVPAREEPNRDGSRTYYHLDREGNRVGTTVVGSDGRVQQRYQRDEDGTTRTRNERSGVAITTTPTGERTITRADGSVERDRIDPATGSRVTTTVRNGQPTQYRSQAERVERETIYVNQPSYSTFDNPWFWMWMMESRNADARAAARERQSLPGYTTSGGNYTTGPGAERSAPAPQQQVFRDFTYDWRQDFPQLPARMTTTVPYHDPMDWVTDYVIMDMINEHATPADQPGMFRRFFMWIGVISRPEEAPHVEYSLSQEIRAQMSSQIVAMIAKVQRRQPIRLADYINVESGEAQKILFIMDKDIQVRNPETQNNCGIDAGDVLELQSHFVGSQSSGLKVIQTSQASDSCERNSTVAIRIADLQDALNDLTRRIERAIAKAAQRRPGMSR